MFANHIRKDVDKKNTRTKRRIKLEKIGIDLFIVTKAIFSYDLRDVQYPFVLFCETYARTVGIRFHSATRHMIVGSIARSKDCRYTRKGERGMSSYLLLYLQTETCIIEGSFVAPKIFVLFV